MNRRTFLGGTVGVLAAGCTISTPVPTPTPAPPTRKGLNACYHGPNSADAMAHFSALGPMTLRAPILYSSDGINILTAMEPYDNLSVNFLVETMNDDLVAEIASMRWPYPVVAISLGNELDLAGVSPQAAHDWTMRSYRTLRNAGWNGDIMAPSIYCVEPDHLRDYAFPMWQGLPDDIVFDLHRYGDPNAGQDGYRNRQDETDTIRRTVGHTRRLYVSEFGYHTTTPQDEQNALVAATTDIGWFAALGADWAYYQYTDGPGTTNLDHYGIRTLDGRWKPVEGIFR